MATETVVITAEKIDSFQLVSHRLPGVKHTCRVRGCSRTGRVKLFWKEHITDRNQQVDWICVNHALDLANEILSVFKFNDTKLEFPLGS